MNDRQKTKNRQEMEANRFAIELLMPREFIEKDLAGKKIRIDDDKLIDEMAKRYQVSRAMMSFRLIDLGYFGPLNKREME